MDLRDEWKLVDKTTLTPMLVHHRALRAEDIGRGCRTDYMDCPFCGKCVASDSIEDLSINCGSFRMSVFTLQDPNLPPHNDYLIWQLNEHLKEIHGITPKEATAMLKGKDAGLDQTSPKGDTL